jgi:hypothetical protein
MKFLVLMYAEPDAWPPDEHEEALAESVELCHGLHEKGQYLSAAPLHPISTAVSVRVRDGKRFVTDGPFAETKEHLGGYFLIDVDTLEEAIEVASRIPGTRRGTAEIRPVVELTNLPGASP